MKQENLKNEVHGENLVDINMKLQNYTSSFLPSILYFYVCTYYTKSVHILHIFITKYEEIKHGTRLSIVPAQPSCLQPGTLVLAVDTAWAAGEAVMFSFCSQTLDGSLKHQYRLHPECYLHVSWEILNSRTQNDILQTPNQTYRT